MKKYLKLALLVIWLGVIFFLSNQTGEVSGNLSNGLLKTIANIFRITNIEQFIVKYQVLIRKTAHFIEYFILGLLIYLNIYEFSKKENITISIILCGLYAITDELHQLFVSDRVFMVGDIILDTVGGIIGILLIYLILKKCCQEKKH